MGLVPRRLESGCRASLVILGHVNTNQGFSSDECHISRSEGENDTIMMSSQDLEQLSSSHEQLRLPSNRRTRGSSLLLFP